MYQPVTSYHGYQLHVDRIFGEFFTVACSKVIGPMADRMIVAKPGSDRLDRLRHLHSAQHCYITFQLIRAPTMS